MSYNIYLEGILKIHMVAKIQSENCRQNIQWKCFNQKIPLKEVLGA